MSVKKNYAVELPESDEVTPFIYQTEEGQGMIWRDAKKVIRKWFLDQAAQLRSFSEAQFLENQVKTQAENNNKVETGAIVPDSSGQAA